MASLLALMSATGCAKPCANRCGGVLEGPAGATAGASGMAGGGASGSGGVGGAPLAIPLPAGACKPAGSGARPAVLLAVDRALAPKVAARRSTLYVADPAAGIYRLEPSATTLERVVAARAADFLAADLNVYYLEAGSLRRASLSASDDMPSTVAAVASDMIRLVGFDEMHLYMIEAGAALLRLPIAGGTPERLVMGSIGDAKMHAGSVYYADRAAMQVFRVPADGGAPKAVVASKYPAIGAVEAGADAIYFADAHVIYAVAADGMGMPRALAVSGLAAADREGPVRRLLLADDRLFFADDANIGWVETDGSACGLVVAGAAQPMLGWDVADDAVYVNRPAAAGSGRELVRFDL